MVDHVFRDFLQPIVAGNDVVLTAELSLEFLLSLFI